MVDRTKRNWIKTATGKIQVWHKENVTVKHWSISSGEGMEFPMLDYLLVQFKWTADRNDTDIIGPTLVHTNDLGSVEDSFTPVFLWLYFALNF